MIYVFPLHVLIRVYYEVSFLYLPIENSDLCARVVQMRPLSCSLLLVFKNDCTQVPELIDY